MPFDPERWRQENLTFESDTRERMAADLITSGALLGLSRTDVIRQLGEPDITGRGAPHVLHYDIRTDYGSDIDPIRGSHLVVELGADELVSSVRTEDWERTK
jgi:hypothetical protein